MWDEKTVFTIVDFFELDCFEPVKRPQETREAVDYKMRATGKNFFKVVSQCFEETNGSRLKKTYTRCCRVRCGCHDIRSLVFRTNELICVQSVKKSAGRNAL